ncbi:MAG: TlpA disulfide reductase family protein [Rhodocyclaceae bacterium]|nr:TlpA disulfide reductase family protein [Rhodocyclaceae bacterium]MDZ4213553.1 TlpA disulfide reductase family protein [Rhodocyclaceae bacterium]
MNFPRFRLFFSSLLLLATGMGHAAGVDSFFAAGLETPNGQAVALDSFRGKPLVVNFIARTCESCATDTRELARQRQANGKLTVVTILVEENQEAVADHVKALGVAHPVLISGNRKGVWLMQNLGNPRGKAPFAVAIDKTGKLAFSTPEALTAATAASVAEAALK